MNLNDFLNGIWRQGIFISSSGTKLAVLGSEPLGGEVQCVGPYGFCTRYKDRHHTAGKWWSCQLNLLFWTHMDFKI